VGSDKEDVVQEGMIGLYKAIRDFEPARGTPFAAFSELCVSRQILTAVKAANRNKHLPLNSSVSIDAPLQSPEGGEQSLGDTLTGGRLSDPANIVISAEEVEALGESLRGRLTDLETDVLRLYLDGKSYDEIAGALGSHAKSIDNALQRVKRKLQAHLNERATTV
jgi:RNA polymerase sporulation-specific sigma factor